MTEVISETALDPSFFRFLGTIGLGSPFTRALAAGAIGLIPAIFKSSVFFYDAGNGVFISKEWSLFADDKTEPGKKTLFPWYLLPVLLAIVSALFL